MCSSCGCGGSGSKGLCMVCKVVGSVMGIIGILAVLAALYGVYHVHFVLNNGFGSLAGSQSLIALFLGMLFIKKAMKMCPCRQAGCGSGCGSKCCTPGQVGSCPMCGKNPCICPKP